MWKGIDVSDNQGIIDWSKVAAAGVQFAILRSVRRSGKTDYQFAANLAGCLQHNIPVSVYKYTYATTEAQAQEEAAQAAPAEPTPRPIRDRLPAARRHCSISHPPSLAVLTYGEPRGQIPSTALDLCTGA